MTMRTLKRFIRHNLRRHGVEISRYTWPQLAESAHSEVVIDIGANIGQYAEELCAGGYRRGISSFEPQSAEPADTIRCSAADDRRTIAARMALDDTQSVAMTGFELWNLAPGFSETRTGRLLQVDCFFVRA